MFLGENSTAEVRKISPRSATLLQNHSSFLLQSGCHSLGLAVMAIFFFRRFEGFLWIERGDCCLLAINGVSPLSLSPLWGDFGPLGLPGGQNSAGFCGAPLIHTVLQQCQPVFHIGSYYETNYLGDIGICSRNVTIYDLYAYRKTDYSPSIFLFLLLHLSFQICLKQIEVINQIV